MRTFAIVLGCVAWVLSCFDAVSYYRANEQQQVVAARLKSATDDAAGTAAFAGQDGARLQNRVKQDEAALGSDEQALLKAQKQGGDVAQDKQALAADQAALQADRMMQYTVENFARLEPNPRVVAAENKVDLNERLFAEAVATQRRDRSLAHGLLAFWVVVAGTAVLAFRGRPAEELAVEAEEDDEGEVESDLATADEADG